MDFPTPIDLFMTKAAEYLLVIGFLGALVLFWRLLARRRPPASTPLPEGPAAATPTGWFGLPLERWRISMRLLRPTIGTRRCLIP